MNKDPLKDIYMAIIYLFIIVIIVFLFLLSFDKKSTLSEITIASCTVGLFVSSVYGIIYKLGLFLYTKNKQENQIDRKDKKE